MAIDAGADSIEHGNDVTDEQLKLMRDRGIYPGPDAHLGSTASGRRSTRGERGSSAFRATLAASDERRRQRAAALVARVLKSGVKFAAGSDMCWFYPGKTRGEASAVMFASLQHAGMPPREIIRAVTT